MRFFPLFLVPLFFLSCGEAIRPVRGGSSSTESSDPTLHLDRNDPELRRIAENARETLPVFIRRLQNPLEGEGNFRIKYPFRADGGSVFGREQIWLEDIDFRDGAYHGTPANTPYHVSTLKTGDTVTFEIDDITDWMYTRRGKIAGGLSIKYLLEQIPEHERSGEQRAILAMFDP